VREENKAYTPEEIGLCEGKVVTNQGKAWDSFFVLMASKEGSNELFKMAGSIQMVGVFNHPFVLQRLCTNEDVFQAQERFR
jgi:hypothetical protein